MQARHRNGVRSNSVGIGGGGGGGGALAASLISPDTSFRPHGNYRNFNRGTSFRRALPKPNPSLQHSHPPRRSGDIFMEAGRLAAEYLVSQGVLPPNVLQTDLQNASLKKQINDFLEFKVQDAENLHQQHLEGRTSALSRLGNAVSDVNSGRRRLPPDEFNPSGSGLRNIRGKGRMESFEAYGSELGRENEKTDSWLKKPKSYPDGDDVLSTPHEQQQGSLDGGGGEISKITSLELPAKSDVAHNSDTELENYELPDGGGPNSTTSNTGSDEFSKGSDNMKILNTDTEELKVCTTNDDMEKQGAAEDIRQHLPVEGNSISNNRNDLLLLCNFGKVPTKARSSLTVKDLKVEHVLTADEENACEISAPQGLKISIREDPLGSSLNEISTHQIHGTKSLVPRNSESQPIQLQEDVAVLDSSYLIEREDCTRFESLPDGSIVYEQPSGEDLSELRNCSPVKDRGEKRNADDQDGRGTKKPRESSSEMVGSVDYFHQHEFSRNSSDVHDESIAPNEKMVEIGEEETLLEAFSPRSGAESGIEFREEKQLFPSSFKICDLNLMESSDITESQDRDPVRNLPSTLEAKSEIPVDVDLTINNACNRSGSSAEAQGVMVAKVEDALTEEGKVFDTSEMKNETECSSLESFPNHMESTGDLPDAQDGYGMMISELLGNDIPNCSPVPVDITGLPTEISLHNGAGILGDDDPIYLTLGEIPISFLGVWEQPAEPYEKPY